MIDKTQERQVIQMKTTAHHQLADAQPAPKHCTPQSIVPPALYAEHEAIECGISLGSLSQLCPLPNPCPPPA